MLRLVKLYVKRDKHHRWWHAYQCSFCASIVERPKNNASVALSCGCQQGGSSRFVKGDSAILTKTHGERGHWAYTLWANIKNRTTNREHPKYGYYCTFRMIPEWEENFESFHTYIKTLAGYGNRLLSLDRENNDLGYIPGNLRFTTTLIQNRNRRPRNSVDI